MPKQDNNMKLIVTHGRNTHEVDVDPGTTLQALMVRLEALTGALARTQKLICKGRVLGAGTVTVEGAKLKDDAKLMMLSSASGVQTQVSVVDHWFSLPSCPGTSICEEHLLQDINQRGMKRTMYATGVRLTVLCNSHSCQRCLPGPSCSCEAAK